MAASSLPFSVLRRLQGKVALITGGARGIGAATAKLFAKYGARVVVADIDDDKGHALCDALGPTAASYVHCDVTIEPDVEAAVDAAVSKHGKLDILFSNAAILGAIDLDFRDSEKSALERVMSTNVTGCFLAAKHAARVMVPARSGSIVMTASTASEVGGIAPHAYTCSKAAVVGLMRNVAVELGKHGIRVNCVSPHGVATAMAMSALGTDGEGVEERVETSSNLKGVRLKAEDVAEAVVYLAGDEGRYVSGINLLVDGGFAIAKSL